MHDILNTTVCTERCPFLHGVITDMQVRGIGNSRFPIDVNRNSCLSICVSSVIDCPWCTLLLTEHELAPNLPGQDRQLRNRHIQCQSQKHLPWEICTSATKRSLRGNLCGMAARSAMALMISSQSAANSSGHSRSRTASDGTVRMMLSNSNSAQGEGAVRSSDQSAAVVTPEPTKGMGPN